MGSCLHKHKDVVDTSKVFMTLTTQTPTGPQKVNLAIIPKFPNAVMGSLFSWRAYIFGDFLGVWVSNSFEIVIFW